MPGNPKPRCGSPASNGAPVAVWRPSTAHSFDGCGRQVKGAGKLRQHRSKPRRRDPKAGLQRRLRVAAPSGSRGHSAQHRRRHLSCQRLPRQFLRQFIDSHRPIVLAHSRLSTGFHGSGAPSTRNSAAAKRPFARSKHSRRAHRRPASPASPPAARPGRPRRPAQSQRPHHPVKGQRRRPGDFRQPPDAARRIRSIWNIRSRACRKPSAAAASARCRRGCAGCRRRRSPPPPAPAARECGGCRCRRAASATPAPPPPSPAAARANPASNPSRRSVRRMPDR